MRLDDEPPLIKIIKLIGLLILGIILGLLIITPVKSANSNVKIVMTKDERILTLEQKTPEIRLEQKTDENKSKEVLEKIEDQEDWILKRKYVKYACELWGIPKKWKIIEAIWQIESGKKLYTNVTSYAGAQGPMQFMPGTWQKYKIDGNKDGVEDINDYEDAIQSAIHYLIASGIKDNEYKAIYAYNHADWYVRQVYEIANSIQE